MIRLGLIGCGAWGWRYVPAALESGNCRVTHVAGANLSGSHDASLLGLHHVTSRNWRALLDAPIDAFIVATPPDTHEEICTTLLNWGRPVMVEKPIALSTRAANAIVEASRKSGATLLVNHQHLFAPAYEELRDRVADWGDARVAVTIGSGNGPRRNYSALWDYGPHDVSMVLGLTRGPREVVVGTARHCRIGSSFSVKLGSTDIRAHVSVSNGSDVKRRLFDVSVGHLRDIRYDDTSAHKLVLQGQPVTVSDENPLTRAVRLFADAVKTGKTDWRFGADMALGVTRILESAERQIAQRAA